MELSYVNDINDFVLIPPSTDQFVNWRNNSGHHLIRRGDTCWDEVKKGFFQPFHLIGKLSYTQFKRPASLLWGYRAALLDKDIDCANGFIPVHRMSSPESFSLKDLSPSRRNELNRSLRKVKWFQVESIDAFHQPAYRILNSSLARTRHMPLPSRCEFYEYCKRNVNPGDNSRVLVSAFVEGELAGFTNIYCVDEVAYLDNLFISSEYLKTGIGAGFYYLGIDICKRSQKIKSIINGMHCIENEGVSFYKRQFGFDIAMIPARVEINPVVSHMLRKYYPHKYYRLTGKC
ncbi:GNAT family N-acetyltransferase [Oceanisphaera arctica]|uniref:GNAT family N-acetyltransferase n=1 Tax=Oceanisphaera arctica TaxID=641510 RepID=UPI0015E386F1|nr:GNAT family N-acetyltransferase [Oceanisphaera arctica]GHA27799.1 hypothetical protein GCM10007082_30040 [Oceanisphaera arctica]